MNRAKQIRIDSGAGLVETSDAAGIGPRTLKRIEAGEEVHAATLRRLAEHYGVQPSELLQPAVFAAPEGEAA